MDNLALSRLTGAVAAATIAFLAAVLCGCSSPNGSTAWAKPTLKSIPVFSEDSSLPFDAYRLSDSELTRMQSEEGQLLAKCDALYGIDVDFGGDYLRPSDESLNMWGGPFGTMSVRQASAFGYHAEPNGPWAHVGGFYLRDPSNVQPEQNADDKLANLVTFGPTANDSSNLPVDPKGKPIPKGGCTRLVETKIGGPLVSMIQITADLINLSLKDSRVVHQTQGNPSDQPKGLENCHLFAKHSPCEVTTESLTNLSSD